MPGEISALEKLEWVFKEFWKDFGNPSVIAAKHTEFMVEPKVFIGNKINPEILKLLALAYLAHAVQQAPSLKKNIEIAPDKLVIKSPNGKPLIIVRDKNIIRQYIASQS